MKLEPKIYCIFALLYGSTCLFKFSSNNSKLCKIPKFRKIWYYLLALVADIFPHSPGFLLCIALMAQGPENNNKFNSFKTFKRNIHYHMSLTMRKPDFGICENKDADQLPGNREADQRLCFRYTDSTIPLLSNSEISSL